MSRDDAAIPTLEPRPSPPAAPAPLSWPPPGLEAIHGRLWRITVTLWGGGVVLVAPLLWALAVDQPFWSLGPFEGNWQIGLGLTVLGLGILLVGFASLVQLLRHAARAADAGYGLATIWEVAADVGRDTGFLVQGRRHFAGFDPHRLERLARARLRSAWLVLAGALWLPAGFALSVLLSARGLLPAAGIWALTLAPALLLLLPGLLLGIGQTASVGRARLRWNREAGGVDRVREEARAWQARLARAEETVALGAGATGRGRSLRRTALGVATLFVLVLVPTVTVALTAAVGPILADTAVPTFLAVQEMAGSAEVLRRYRLEVDPTITPQQAGESLQNLVFVGPTQRPEAMERPPRVGYRASWFTDPDVFPDPYSETAAGELIARDFGSFSPAERLSLLQAAAHPAHAEFERLSHASLADIVATRWVLPFPDGMSVFELPWPRFAALRAAGLAHVARAAFELSEGRRDDAEHTIREVISAGFLLVDEGPTLVDNLMGVVLAGMGGDALEALYARTGRAAEAERLRWARESSELAARTARIGNLDQDIHTLLRGIPDLVEREDALRGLRWEYLATFNMLAPCINLRRMVFGPDDSYDAWMERTEEALVRVGGEAALFELARSGAAGSVEDGANPGALARFLGLTLGSRTQPGSCARLVSALELADARAQP